MQEGDTIYTVYTHDTAEPFVHLRQWTVKAVIEGHAVAVSVHGGRATIFPEDAVYASKEAATEEAVRRLRASQAKILAAYETKIAGLLTESNVIL